MCAAWRKLVLIITLLSPSLLAGCGGATIPSPPLALAEVQPARPSADSRWVPGRWQWVERKQDYVWVTGHWAIPWRGTGERHASADER